jgi:branched-chain amino acid transport system substrate-binding protein
MHKSTFLRLVLVLLAVVLVGGMACKSSTKKSGTTTPKGTAAKTIPKGTSASSGNVPGVTASQVTLGTHTSITGPIAAYNVIPKFAKAYFDDLNTKGGVNNRTINYILKDDAYNPAQAVDLTHQLVEQDHIFAMFNALGTPNHLQVVDYLQQNGVPDMFVATGAAEWVKDPSTRPLVFGSNPNYEGEGVAIGMYIASKYAGKKVGVIYQNDDFGQDGLKGLKIGIGTTVTLAGSEPYEVTDPDINSQVDRLKSAGSDVVAFWATPLLLGVGIKHARADLNWNAPFFISSVSMNELTGLIAGPANIEGTMGPVATYTPQETSNAGIAAHIAFLSGAGSGVTTTGASILTLYAQYVSELMVQTLKTAQEPLTRDSLVKAAEGLTNWKCSVCLFPVNLSATDHDPSQAIAMGVFEGGKVKITKTAYSWEGVKIADLSPTTLKEIAVPADAVNATNP